MPSLVPPMPATPPTSTTPDAHESPAILCSEVWGGNRAVAAELALPGLEGWVLSRPYQGEAAGGDVHYISSCGTGRITRLLLADVAGHGEAVAGLGENLRRAMQRYLNHVAPHKLARRMNRDVGDIARDTGRFATALVMTYWAPNGGLSLVNAGHPPPLIYRRAKAAWDYIDQPDDNDTEDTGVTNLPLGVVEDAGYTGRRLMLEPGDVVLAYTDCLIEALDAGRDMLGGPGLLDTMNQLEIDPATQPMAAVIDALLDRLAGRGFALEDDLTVMAVRCTGRSRGAGLGGTIGGMTRMLKSTVTRGPVPWPEVGRGAHV